MISLGDDVFVKRDEFNCKLENIKWGGGRFVLIRERK